MFAICTQRSDIIWRKASLLVDLLFFCILSYAGFVVKIGEIMFFLLFLPTENRETRLVRFLRQVYHVHKKVKG